MKDFPDWLILCVWRALIGEIYPSIRAIALSLTDDRTLLIFCYLDRQPRDFDWESLEVVATNISASAGQDKILRIDLECKYDSDPIGSLKRFGGFVYCRREYEL
ncbi:colicin [Pseudomonas avellanae]|uniref:Colicin n=2 Tax=Pseudomonas syringae group TaxID=136849 RepID=A0AAD0DLP9_9PSED|nr:colicin [Pseudomonas avellanae]POP87934.1 colicin [Pseudomonas amygdali pv. morsprunorum]RML51788.1 Colicin D [Pseudomonas amygdali pv. morsprunorum]